MTAVDVDLGRAQQEALRRALAVVDDVLTAEVADLQARLDGSAPPPDAPHGDIVESVVGTHSCGATSWWVPIERLGLSPVELAIVAFAVAPEVSRRAGYQYSMLGDGPAQQWPTVDLLCRLLSRGRISWHEVRSLLRPGAALVRRGIVRVDRLAETDSSLAAVVRPAEPVTARLLQLADDAHPAVRVVPARDRDALQGWFDDEVGRTLERADASRPAVLFVSSTQPEAALAAAHHLAAGASRAIVEVDLGQLDADRHESAIDHARLLAMVDDAVCVVLGGEGGHRHLLRLVDSGEPQAAGLRPVLVAIPDWGDVAAPVRQLGVVVHLPPPDPSTRRRAWVVALTAHGRLDAVDGPQLNTLAHRYELTRGDIDAVIAHAAASDRAVDFHALVTAAGTLAGAVLADVAERVESTATWHDLVVPEATMAALRHVATAIRQRDIVMSGYRVGNRSSATGAAVLFAGPSGTGKTLAASVIAGELEAELYRVNLATIVSKYIGETEKNLERVFTAAQRGGAMLLFDEADAIFGKRSDVRDAHDRYANLETAYLLQRIEQHHGAVILTTNARHHLDPAFLRRFAAIVQFPDPSELERRRLWDVLLGQEAPRAATLDLCRLARDNTVNGGEIAAVLIDAAAGAAEAHEPIDHRWIDEAIVRLQQRRGR